MELGREESEKEHKAACDECAADHRQLAEWLTELKERRAADVQPVRRGKWNTHDVVKVLCSGKTLDGFCQCTACGDVFPLHYSEYNYCPNCGARMKED